MTREEQINQDEKIFAADQCDIELAFKEGAKWADEHPKEGMVSIDKVCDWLVVNAEDNVESALDLVAKFKRAMEE